MSVSLPAHVISEFNTRGVLVGRICTTARAIRDELTVGLLELDRRYRPHAWVDPDNLRAWMVWADGFVRECDRFVCISVHSSPTDLFSYHCELEDMRREFARVLALFPARPASFGASSGDSPDWVCAPPPYPPAFADLWELISTLELIKNENEAVKQICRGGGRVPLADLAITFGWSNTPDDFNSLRRRLNKKFRKHGWNFRQHNNCAKAERIPKRAD